LVIATPFYKTLATPGLTIKEVPAKFNHESMNVKERMRQGPYTNARLDARTGRHDANFLLISQVICTVND
jgi:hypothetical protein